MLFRVDAGGIAVDVLAEDVYTRGDEVRRGGRLLRRRVPRVRPDQLDLRSRVRRLSAEGERVRVPHDLGRPEGNRVADDTLLARGARGHAGEVDRVLARPEVLGLVLLDLCPGRLLEEDVGVLLVQLPVRAVRKVPERASEDHLVALSHEAGDDLRDLRVREDVLLVRRLHLRPEHLLDQQAPAVMRLRPAVVVVRARIDPGHLERRRRSRLRRAASRGDERGRGESEDERPHYVLPHVRLQAS